MTERHFISLGGGVQSSVMLLLADRGHLEPRPEAAIFADTHWEPPAVYEHLEWLEAEVSIPIQRVSGGDLRAASMRGESAQGYRAKDGGGFTSLPLYTGGGGMGRRSCTHEYKVKPITKWVRREALGLAYRQRAPKDVQVVQWMGISLDEITRLKESKEKWVRFHYPLVWELEWTRQDCLKWFAAEYPGRTLARSACVACPYHHDKAWAEIKADPELWADAVEFDQAIRHITPGMEKYVHRSMVPLEDVDLTDPAELQYSLWEMECEGMCGV